MYLSLNEEELVFAINNLVYQLREANKTAKPQDREIAESTIREAEATIQKVKARKGIKDG
jgi:hypothetical protein